MQRDRGALVLGQGARVLGCQCLRGSQYGIERGCAAMQAQIRQRMAERFREDFGTFRSSLDDAQRQQWDAALAAPACRCRKC